MECLVQYYRKVIALNVLDLVVNSSSKDLLFVQGIPSSFTLQDFIDFLVGRTGFHHLYLSLYLVFYVCFICLLCLLVGLHFIDKFLCKGRIHIFSDAVYWIDGDKNNSKDDTRQKTQSRQANGR